MFHVEHFRPVYFRNIGKKGVFKQMFHVEHDKNSKLLNIDC